MYLARYLTWIFAVLFVLLGVVALAADGEASRRFWGGLSVLSLGGFAASVVVHAILAGRIRVRYSVIRRARQSRSFWAAIVLIGAAGAVVLIGALWLLFFKT